MASLGLVHVSFFFGRAKFVCKITAKQLYLQQKTQNFHFLRDIYLLKTFLFQQSNVSPAESRKNVSEIYALDLCPLTETEHLHFVRIE